MVWAVSSPTSLGVYFPAGDYVGWKERLFAYYKNEMTPEEKTEYSIADYADNVIDKFKMERQPPSGARNLCPIRPHEAPDHYKMAKTFPDLGSMITLTYGNWAVEGALKKIIEQLEPHVHEFYPIKMITPNGQAYPKKYFLLVIGQYLESFSLSQSKRGTWRQNSDFPERYSIYSWTKLEISGLAFEKSKFGNAHLWRERAGGFPQIFFSDALKAEIDKSDLHMPRIFRAKEV